MRAGPDTALARVVKVFGSAREILSNVVYGHQAAFRSD